MDMASSPTSGLSPPEGVRKSPNTTLPVAVMHSPSKIVPPVREYGKMRTVPSAMPIREPAANGPPQLPACEAGWEESGRLTTFVLGRQFAALPPLKMTSVKPNVVFADE